MYKTLADILGHDPSERVGELPHEDPREDGPLVRIPAGYEPRDSPPVPRRDTDPYANLPKRSGVEEHARSDCPWGLTD